jgi:glycosyltransferase involved in cell wall biosynthesis
MISEHASPLAPTGAVDSGGQNVYVAQLASHLARRGFEIDVFVRRDRSLLPPVVNWQPGVRVFHVPAGPARIIPKEELLPMMRPFGSVLERSFAADPRGYDLVHANFFMSGLAAIDAARRCDIPLVMTFHALGLVRRRHLGAEDRFPAERFAIEARLAQESRRIIAVCKQDLEDLTLLYGADPSRIDIVPCGVDAQEIVAADAQRARATLGLAPDEFIVLSVGRLVRRKGVENIVRAIAELKRQGRAVRLCIVGGNSESPSEEATPEIGRLAAVAESLGVRSQVHFAGRRSRAELGLYYSAADVFVSTPWYEPFGITPLEAMICSRPVVASAVGGLKSTVVDGVTGYLVEPENPAALAAGQRRAASKYSWTLVAERTADVYARAIEEHRRGSAAASLQDAASVSV